MIKNTLIKEWYSQNKVNLNCEITKILDVEYIHLKLGEQGDLYITEEGFPFLGNLMPDCFLIDEKWFNNNSLKLSGTSCVYKVKTKMINNKQKDVVVKWNRMGQEIPGIEESEEMNNAEFNSPFEEFSLVKELRKVLYKSSHRIILQKPLAIYTPISEVELSRYGRKKYKMNKKIESHKDVILNMLRSYAVIYEWIDGIDLVQALDAGLISKEYMELLSG